MRRKNNIARMLPVFVLQSLLAVHFVFAQQPETELALEMPPKAYEKIAPVAVRILCENGLKVGSGTLIGITPRGAGIILTACHVVASNYRQHREDADLPIAFHNDIEVKIGLDSTYVAAVALTFPGLRYYDASNDVALLVTRKPVGKERVARYNHSAGVKPGQLIAAVGFPHSDELTLTVGQVTRLQEKFIVFDARVVPGNSGGPLIDKHGRMIGISIQTFQNEGYALPMDLILPIADGWIQSLDLPKAWKRQKYPTIWARMIKDPVFILSELAVAGLIGYCIFKPPDDPTAFPAPPGVPAKK